MIDLLVARAGSAASSRLHAGEIPVCGIPALAELLTEMTVRAATHGMPFFGVGEAVETVDATTRMLTKKFAGSYSSEAPMELLLYWTATPAPRTAQWRDEILARIRTGRPSSPFRRVWCFDLFRRAVVIVEPEPVTASDSGAARTPSA